MLTFDDKDNSKQIKSHDKASLYSMVKRLKSTMRQYYLNTENYLKSNLKDLFDCMTLYPVPSDSVAFDFDVTNFWCYLAITDITYTTETGDKSNSNFTKDNASLNLYLKTIRVDIDTIIELTFNDDIKISNKS